MSENKKTKGLEFNTIKRSMNGYEMIIAMGGFVGTETKRHADADIKLMLRELSEKFEGEGVPKQMLISGALNVVMDMIDEYVPEEDGGLFDYLSDFACESMAATIEEATNTDYFRSEEKGTLESDALSLLPSLQKKLLKLSRDGSGNKLSSECVARDLEYLRPSLTLKGIVVAERNYSLNLDMLTRALGD